MNRTKIEYLDYTLNLVVGCSGIGCAVRAKCWAKGQEKRQKHRCISCYIFTPHYHRERLEQPLHVKNPSRIGLNFTGETFDVNLPNREIVWKEILDMTRRAYWHTFVILTKQPQNIPEDLDFPSNVIVGVSVNRFVDKWRIEDLKTKKIQVKTVSFEPLYESMIKESLDCFDPNRQKERHWLSGIDWVIIGSQTRPLIEPNPDWIWEIIFEATALDIPLFLKNNLHHANPIQQFPEAKT